MFRIDFELKFSDSAIITIMKRLVTANDIKHGSIYIQVSRGEYSRDHSYFNMTLKPILVIPANIFPSRDLVISILFLFNIQKFELDPSVIYEFLSKNNASP